MAKRPTPSAIRKVLDELEVPERFRKAEMEVISPEPRKKTYSRPDPPPPIKLARGRPPTYNDDFPEVAFRLGLLGLTDVEIAAFFGVTERVIYEWDNAHPDFFHERTRARVFADANVVESVYKRATGFEYDAVKIFMPAGAPAPVYAPYVEYVPPDTQAARWWLQNRQKERWKEASEVKVVDPLEAEKRALMRAELIRRLDLKAVPEPLTIEGKAERKK
jgi:hypothetical protein